MSRILTCVNITDIFVLNLKKKFPQVCCNSVADLGGARDVPPGPKCLYFHAVFRNKLAK